ncbi:MAG: hypothetical protein ACXIUB_11140 [Wenzhouxiangella sp.]
MKTKASILLALIFAAPLVSAQTLLMADFNNKPLNQPIGTGGAVMGEPTFVSPVIDAIVRQSPGGGRMLEMFMEERPSTASVRFQFFNDQEVTGGQVLIQARVRLAAEDEFSNIGISLREANGATQSFLNMNLLSNNRRLQVIRPGVPVTGFNGVLALSDANDLAILYDLDEAQISVCLNGSLLIDELPTLFESTRGIGSLLLSQSGIGGDTVVNLEELRVRQDPDVGPDPDLVFSDRFEVSAPACPFL